MKTYKSVLVGLIRSHAYVCRPPLLHTTTAAAAGGAAGAGGNAAGGAVGGGEASGMGRREFTKLKSLLLLMQKASTHPALVNLGQVTILTELRLTVCSCLYVHVCMAVFFLPTP